MVGECPFLVLEKVWSLRRLQYSSHRGGEGSRRGTDALGACSRDFFTNRIIKSITIVTAKMPGRLQGHYNSPNGNYYLNFLHCYQGVLH